MKKNIKPKILIYEDSEDLCTLYKEYMKYAIKDIDYDLTVISKYEDFLPNIGKYFDIAIIDWILDTYKERKITAAHVLMAIDYSQAYLVSGYVSIDDALSDYASRMNIPIISKGANIGIKWMDFIRDAVMGFSK